MKISIILLVSLFCFAKAQFGFPGLKLPGANLASQAGSIPGLSSIPKLPGISDFLKQDFGSFKNTFNKVYKSAEEEAQRLNIFANNKEKIAGLNDLFEKGVQSFKVAENIFSDLTLEEFRNRFNGFGKNLHRPTKQGPPAEKFTAVPSGLPDHVDWREKGLVSPVKFQGDCASCWAFSAAGALEAINRNNFKEVSPQHLLDCSGPYGSSGCSGGLMNHAFQFAIANQGVGGIDEFPYKAKAESCKNSSNTAATSKGFVEIPENNEMALQTAVAKVGPVAAAINANLPSFQFYEGGVYDDPKCDNTLSHAVLIVGYGEEDGKKYWIIKNSYSDKWGENGYMKLLRGKNLCGIAVQASFPVAE